MRDKKCFTSLDAGTAISSPVSVASTLPARIPRTGVTPQRTDKSAEV